MVLWCRIRRKRDNHGDNRPAAQAARGTEGLHSTAKENHPRYTIRCWYLDDTSATSKGRNLDDFEIYGDLCWDISFFDFGGNVYQA